MRSTRLLLPALVAGPLAVLPLAFQEADATQGAPDTPRCLNVWSGRLVPDEVDLARETVAEIAATVRESYPNVSFSIYETHRVEADDVIVFFAEVEGPRELSDVYRRVSRDGPYRELLATQDQFLVEETRTRTVLRQIAGPESKAGEPWAQRQVIHWSVRARFAEIGAALEAARGICEHVNRHAAGVRARAYVEVRGQADTIHWYFEVAGREVWDLAEAQLLADVEYLALRQRATGSFVEGSFSDVVLTTVH